MSIYTDYDRELEAEQIAREHREARARGGRYHPSAKIRIRGNVNGIGSGSVGSRARVSETGYASLLAGAEFENVIIDVYGIAFFTLRSGLDNRPLDPGHHVVFRLLSSEYEITDPGETR